VVNVPEIDRSSTTDRVAEALRDLLFSGEVSPGEALREIGLADAFHVARSTVREALQLLAAEGLVTRFPNRGVVVTELTGEDIAEIFGARLVLESAGARAGALGADLSGVAAALATYATATESGTQADITHTHLQFHTSIVALIGNARLVANVEALTGDLRLALASVERERANARQQVGPHRRLLRQMRSGDVDAAVAELERHLTAARASVHDQVMGRQAAVTS
jgi:DNA-binding GntR family transcriptional regulator